MNITCLDCKSKDVCICVAYLNLFFCKLAEKSILIPKLQQDQPAFPMSKEKPL